MSYHITPTFQGEAGDRRSLHCPVDCYQAKFNSDRTSIQRPENYRTADLTGDASKQLHRNQVYSIVALIGQGSLLVNFNKPVKNTLTTTFEVRGKMNHPFLLNSSFGCVDCFKRHWIRSIAKGAAEERRTNYKMSGWST